MSPKVVPLSAAQLDETTRIHAQAFAGYMNTRLGPGYVHAFLGWFARHENAIALVSCDDTGRPLGYVVGAPLGYTSSMTRELLFAALRGALLRPWLALDARIRRTALDRLLGLVGRGTPPAPSPTLPEPVLSLVGIGVGEAARGQGHGQALLAEFEREARRRQARALRLSVYPDNASARRAYERAGWQPFGGERWPGYAMYYSKVLA
jgi:ribosomal protein S18 acetylase RimI-like enzyme